MLPDRTGVQTILDWLIQDIYLCCFTVFNVANDTYHFFYINRHSSYYKRISDCFIFHHSDFSNLSIKTDVGVSEVLENAHLVLHVNPWGIDCL